MSGSCRFAGKGITFTGLDERTPVLAIAQMARDYPEAEFGILWSMKREGEAPRYPCMNKIWALLDLMPKTTRLAIHVCGRKASEAVVRGEYQGLLRRGNLRIQINGKVLPSDLDILARNFYTQQTIITQATSARDILLRMGLDNHAVLIDRSGGSGALPVHWWRPDTDKAVGFAGGLGPETLPGQIDAIAEVAKPGDWLDMETKVRTDDWFDLAKCREVCEIVRQHRRKRLTQDEGVLDER